MESRRPAVVLALEMSLGVALSGCLAFDEAHREEIDVAEQPIITTNALTTGALTTNALTGDAITTNALMSHPLTTAALTTNAPVLGALSDGTTREFFSYLVSCALPLGAHVDVDLDCGSYGFDGQIGLAPQWGNAGGTCDGQCREWVSACVLSRVNYLGLQVPISARGSKPALALSGSEALNFSEREGAYFGDVFAQPQIRFACLSPGKSTNVRVCGPSINSCVIEVVGSCDDACSSAHPSTGAFPNCRENAAAKWFPAITVFLAQ